MRTFSLGKLVLPSKVLCAPLAGCSDVPFRMMLAKYHPGLMYCEMVKMEALIRKDPQTYKMLEYQEMMRPIGAQICGSNPAIAGACAKIVEDMGFDVIDLNCGCPVDKVTKDGSGSGMLKTPDNIGRVVSEMVRAVNVPVTVKIRAGWDSEHINAPEVVKIVREAGAAAICVHGRTRAQGYQGPANWDYIRACKEASGDMPLIGNGDVFHPAAAQGILETTGCDAFLLARGLMGSPWLIEDIHCALEGVKAPVRPILMHKEALLEHMDYIVTYRPEHKAVLDMRRVGCWYLRNIRGAKQLRESINHSATLSEVRMHIESSSWDIEGSPQPPSSD